jgi:hypothetical protein
MTEEKPVQNSPEDTGIWNDPHFVPADDPNFISPPDEPKMDASGPTDRNAEDLGPVPDGAGEVTDADCDGSDS